MASRIDILHPQDLSRGDAAAWSALQSGHDAFSSPLLSFQFARAVGAVRDDAKLAVWREDGQPAGFLAFHRRPGAFARPIGAPFSDLHGVVSQPGAWLAPGEFLDRAGVRALKINGLVDPFGLLASGPQIVGHSRRIVLDGAAEPYLERLRAQSRNGAKNFKRYSQKLAREIGEVTVQAPDRSLAAFERLLSWKSTQLRASGLHDVVGVGWTLELLQRLFDTKDRGFEGLMISLYAGRRHVAGQFGVRLNGHYHPWIAAMAPDAKAYSPGAILQWKAIEAMPGLGLNIYELGEGEERWKAGFSLDALPVRSGLATAANSSGRFIGAQERLYEWPSRKVPTVGRLRRRLDHIAATELTLAGRTQGVMDALAGFERRNAARQAAAPGA